MTTVRAWTPSDATAWDAYVLARPRATFFHQSGWMRVLERTFRFKQHSLVVERDGRLCGILPLFGCRSIKGKLALYSLPHTVYGGPVGDDLAAEQALVAEAERIGRAIGARSIELRNRHETLVDVPVRASCVTFEKELPETVDEVRGTFPKKAREAINQATKRHKLECDFEGDFDTFYDLLADSYLTLGTPVFPKAFFKNILEEFGDDAIVQIVRHEGRPVAACLSTIFRGTMMPLYSGEAPGVKNLKAGNFKYFRLMQEAVARGLRRFDFGRSRLNNEGVVKFKTNQGFQPEPLPYQCLELTEGAGDTSNPNSGIYLRLRKAWRKLPSPVARMLGPRLIRYFP
ncbi:MAG: FemAB family XrtA/PEP-CTERM system-associated protein [Planctomycetota bacterium]